MTLENRSSFYGQLYLAGSPDHEEDGTPITKANVLESVEYNALLSLVENSGYTVFQNDQLKAVSIRCPDIKSVDSKAGLSLIANLFFDTRFPFVHTTIVENEKGRIEFLFKEREIISFSASKIVVDPFGRTIHYVDIQGTDKESAGQKYGQVLGRLSLNITSSNATGDIVLAARTQNPREVSLLRKVLPDDIKLAPFWAEPSDELIKSINWLVQGGAISRNQRADNRFDANESLINWGAYGVYGDGSTWEDMDKFDLNIRWDLEAGIAMQEYALRHGTSIGPNLGEMRTKGHAFMVGAYIKR